MDNQVKNDKPTIQQTINYFGNIGQQNQSCGHDRGSLRQEHGHPGGWTGHHTPAISYRLA